MMNAVLALLDSTCSPKFCSRGAMVGVILLSFWAVGHASDQRVHDVEDKASIIAVSVSIDGIRDEQARVREELEKTRKENKEANAEQTRKLERLESLLLQLLSRR